MSWRVTGVGDKEWNDLGEQSDDRREKNKRGIVILGEPGGPRKQWLHTDQGHCIISGAGWKFREEYAMVVGFWGRKTWWSVILTEVESTMKSNRNNLEKVKFEFRNKLHFSWKQQDFPPSQYAIKSGKHFFWLQIKAIWNMICMTLRGSYVCWFKSVKRHKNIYNSYESSNHALGRWRIYDKQICAASLNSDKTDMIFLSPLSSDGHYYNGSST